MSDAYVDVTLPDGSTQRALRLSSGVGVTSFRNPDDVFVTSTTGDTAILAVVFDAAGGRITYIFADAAARDAFFNTAGNTNLLFQGVTVALLQDDGAGNTIEQLWNGADQPASYVNTNWVTRPAGGQLDAQNIKTLYESNADTNAFTDAFLAVLNQLRFENNRIISSVSIETPPGSLALGEGTVLSNAIRTINLRSDVTGDRSLVLTQEYDETNGVATASVFSGGAMSTVDLNDPPGTDTSNTATFTLTATADEIITAFSVETNQISQSVDFTLTGRTSSQSGPIAFNFSGQVTTNANGIAVVNLIQDFNPLIVDSGDQIFLSATATGLVGVQSGPDFTPNTTVNRIVIQRQRLALFDEIVPQEQADWNETDSGAVTFIQNKPTIPTPRTDEEVRDIVGATLVAGSNITIDVNDAANTITISGTGGGPVPQPGPNDFRYGLSQQSDPALVDFGTLTDVASPADPQTVSTGTTSAGDYFHIFSANTHDIQTITDTVLQQIVYQDGATGNIFTKTDNSRTEASVTYDAYTVGPLNAGVDEEYVVRFS